MTRDGIPEIVIYVIRLISMRNQLQDDGMEFKVFNYYNCFTQVVVINRQSCITIHSNLAWSLNEDLVRKAI